MRTILQKNITIEVRLIEQAAQVDIQDPPFSTKGVGGIPGRQNRAIYTTFGHVIAASARTSNRPGKTLISAAKTAQQVEIEQVR